MPGLSRRTRRHGPPDRTQGFSPVGNGHAAFGLSVVLAVDDVAEAAVFFDAFFRTGFGAASTGVEIATVRGLGYLMRECSPGDTNEDAS